MVKFYSPKQSKNRPVQEIKTLTIDALDAHGQGVCKRHQPVVFVEGALPGEECKVQITSSQKNYAQATLKSVMQPVKARTEPFCPVYEHCGGCQLQHVESSAALKWRQQAIGDYWRKHLALSDIPWQAPITGSKPAYRRKTRLAVDARNPEKFKLGFRQQGSKKIVEIDHCPVLLDSLSALIKPLTNLLSTHPSRANVGHITLLAGENIALVQIKLIRQLSNHFKGALIAFANDHKVNVSLEYSQGNVETLVEHEPLYCQLDGSLYLTPGANDFVQVNDSVNRKMIDQAIDWLDLNPTDAVADLFCGLGNFTLPLAKRVKHVLAIEGVAEMVQRGQLNARNQGINNIQWQHGDLTETSLIVSALDKKFDAVVLDPSREGAREVCSIISQSTIQKILYVSCNPTTFARDAALFLQQGYRMDKISLIEMFPFTKHLEIMSLFTLQKSK
ncbi:23S rRNA (uracil(1939)-C(5))-methyltransferase RlmD [Alteromonas sp. ASW11-130]|uniref:23S rRNA (uracil(1939)-C(5))-methyltransferase RlmD n=1 Tax=Alteromonas sp. ASW11-130 TaxID=3015775 RepID=UPI00224198B5|nr:23S rRNA (uracil(1939)-C(5))-methyltransferase RlmD [Alteromonas sp. ASW11-130]MCW8090469.1 23S rRNA (uracil(1939)-C(5))-methyltransferase RlmD [Alteromonas sp. ASW11-130]